MMNKFKNQKNTRLWIDEKTRKKNYQIKSKNPWRNLLKKCSNLNLKTKQKIYQDLELPAYPANLLICDPRFYVKDWLAEHKTRRQQQMIATTTPSLSLASASVLLKSHAGAQPRGGAKVACMQERVHVSCVLLTIHATFSLPWLC